jgi:organic radical activating enzyme
MVDTYCKRAEYELILRSFNDDVEAALCCKSQHPVSLFDKGALDKVRDDLENGIQNKHCSVCWLHEKNGLDSWRLQGNVSRIAEKSIEVYLDNTCDQKCIYCSAKFSSKWAQEINQAQPEDKKFLTSILNDDTFVATQKKNHIDIILENIANVGEASRDYHQHQIILLGGEPLLSPQVKKDVINDIVGAFYSKTEPTRQLKIMVVTNGNSPDIVIDRALKSIKETSEKYENLKFTINLSMESTGSNAEFVRNGVDWNQFIKNYQKYLENNLEVGFSMTLNSVSFLDTPNFMRQMINYAKNSSGWRQRTFFRVNVAQYPKHLSIATLPEEYRYIFEECKSVIEENKEIILDELFIETFAREIHFAEKLFGKEPNKKLQIKTALTYFDYLKKTRGQDLEVINPRLYNYLRNYNG